MVSSGGMLVQKLNAADPQCDLGEYDSTMAYAQNKRQQVIMIEQYARKHPKIYFSSMHPGWADTPGKVSFHSHKNKKYYPSMLFAFRTLKICYISFFLLFKLLQ